MHNGAMLSRSERPPRYQGTTWWIVAVVERDRAVRVDARSVHRPQCEPLRRSGDACAAWPTSSAWPRPSSTTGMISASQHQPPHGGDRECRGVVGLADRAAREAGTQRAVVDQDADRRHPTLVVTATDGGDQRLHLELLPRQGLVPRLARVAARGGAGDRSPEGTVTHRVEADHGVTHAGLTVDPTLDLRRRPLTLQLLDVGATGVYRGPVTGQIAAVAPEHVDAVPLGIGEQLAAQRQEVGLRCCVEVAGHLSDRIDMAGRHRACCQRLLERRQSGTHPLAVICSARIPARLAAITGQQITRRFAAPLSR